MFHKLLAGAVVIGAIVGTSATQTGYAQTASARAVVEPPRRRLEASRRSKR